MKTSTEAPEATGLNKFILMLAAGLSSLIYLFTFHVLKYRYKVIKKNLATSFGIDGDKNVKGIISKYYQH